MIENIIPKTINKLGGQNIQLDINYFYYSFLQYTIITLYVFIHLKKKIISKDIFNYKISFYLFRIILVIKLSEIVK